MTEDDITPDEARERLAAAASLAAATHRRGATVGAITTAGLVVLGRRFSRPYARAFTVTIVLYAVGIALLPQRWPSTVHSLRFR